MIGKKNLYYFLILLEVKLNLCVICLYMIFWVFMCFVVVIMYVLFDFCFIGFIYCICCGKYKFVFLVYLMFFEKEIILILEFNLGRKIIL